MPGAELVVQRLLCVLLQVSQLSVPYNPDGFDSGQVVALPCLPHKMLA